MNPTTRQKWLRRKRRIARRLAPRKLMARGKPMFMARNIRYEMADRTRAIACGGIGAVHLLARKVQRSTSRVRAAGFGRRPLLEAEA